MDKLAKCEANYTTLTPIAFLQRAATVYSDRMSIVYEQTRFTWKQTYDRCRRLASSLQSLNIAKNDVVSVLAPNIPALYEMHFAVPMAGGVLNAINTRLDSKAVAAIIRHSEAKVLFVDYEYVGIFRDALKHLMSTDNGPLPLVAVIDDVDSPTGVRLGELEYEQLVARGDPSHEPYRLADEWDAIALNYTSGTTSVPKGVVYSHRGAYLSSLTLLLQWEVGSEPVYLWSLPMFHCNGWTFTWGMAARGGTNVCIRAPAAADIYRAIAAHRITHMCCAPTVFNLLLDSPTPLSSPVQVLTGGAPPPAALLEKVERAGFRVTHAYGMTEATGPALVFEWREAWDHLSPADRAAVKTRQGISVLSLADADVRDARTMAGVPHDGRTMGEIVLRGSSLMKGYFKNEAETAASFRNGWFLTGDLGVVHPDGYMEIKDRSKDVIISGGENISSIEVGEVLFKHPAVVEAAVVAMPHPHWGETPCAFVVAREGTTTTEEEIILHCKGNLPRFMVPKKVVFLDELPKNSTGKIQKNELREMARGLRVSWERPNHAQDRKKAPVTSSGNRKKRANDNQEQVLAISRL